MDSAENTSWTSWPTGHLGDVDRYSFPLAWGFLRLADVIISRFTAWYGDLGIASFYLILFTALCSSFLLTRHLYANHPSRNTMATRWTLALVVVIASLTLGLPQVPSQAPAAADDDDSGMPVIPNILDPLAVDAQSVCPGYKASNVETTSSGMTADLILAGTACNLYGNDIEALTLSVEHQEHDRLHVRIQPKFIGHDNFTWFILPEDLMPAPQIGAKGVRSGLDFTWTNEPSFSFNVMRKSTGDVLFTTQGSQLVYEDQFIEFASSLPENYNLYGLGEVIHGFRLGNNLTRTLYAADVGNVIDANSYGTHPIYYDTRYFKVDEGTEQMIYAPNATDRLAKYKSYTHAVFNRNVHGQEVLLRERNITWRALGGNIDLYFYQGPTQDEITKSYQKSAVGLPAMQQFWAFGYHQCRWGYRNWSELQDVVDNFKKHDIPLDTIWSDIDYLNHYRDFENDPVQYSYDEGAKFLSRIHGNKQHWVPIVDSAIYFPTNKTSYSTFEDGREVDAFMLNPDGSMYVGKVWPGYTVFPDWIGAFFNGTGANAWWARQIRNYWEGGGTKKGMEFDGIWIDMSEVSSFCVGSCGSRSLHLDAGDAATDATGASRVSPASTEYYRTTPTPGVRNVNWPPYTINNYGGDLAVHAVSPNATHHGGYLEYDFHSLFGHQILNATYHALLDLFPTKRPFIIGRSQAFGSAKWAGHWGGDNYSLWAYMFFAIPQALSFSLFGFPMFGVDTCGFQGDTNMELCARWMQLSAFFPFYRNHNDKNAASQEPYLWPEVAAASKAAMKIRYALLPYIYTTFYLSHMTGSTTMRALAWDFPDEPWLADADRQFLLGDAVLVTPCLVQGATTVDGVFPGAGAGSCCTVWYDWYNQTAVEGVSAGQNVTIDAPLGHIPVYIKGGHVLPLKEPGLTTAEVRKSQWSLLVALDAEGQAKGGLYLDDGESLAPNETTWVSFFATDRLLIASAVGNYSDATTLANVTVMGVKKPVSNVKLNGAHVPAAAWALDADGGGTGVLRVTGLGSLTRKGAWAEDWTLSWQG